jgi:hypothetical protein
MKSTILEARTVTVVRELKVEKRTGVNGEFESKDILIRIAVDRDYKVTRTENGKTISEYPTDFWLAKATGPLADVINNYCTATKEDGKLVSRHLLLSGSFENYTNTRKVKVQPQVEINGVMYQLDLETEVPSNNTIFVIDAIKFLDRNPEAMQAQTANTVTTATVTPVTPVPVAQPVAQAPQAVQVVQPTEAPTVAANYTPAGETAPF